MSSRARNFRRRADEDEEEAEAKDSANGTVAQTSTSKSSNKSVSKSAAAATKPKKLEHKVPKLLSFVEDEDADDGPFSRPSSKKTPSSRPAKPLSTKPASSSGHKISSNKERVRPSSLPSNVQPQAGAYTIEALRELQKNTKTLASSRPAVAEAKSEPVVVLKGLLKPVKSVADTLKEVDELDEEESGEKKDRDGVQGRLDSLRIEKGKEAVASGSDSAIPDQATIEMIRAKRERMRQSRAAAPDYIALDGGSNHGEAEGLSDEEPEFQGRIKMLGEKSDKKGVFEEVEERVAGPSFGIDDDGNDDEDDEEKIWEEEQFRKGLGKRMDDGPSRLATSNVPLINNTPQQLYGYPASGYSSVSNAPLATNIGGVVAASHMREVQTIAQQADNARKAMKDSVGRLKDSFGRTVNSLSKTKENLSASILNVTNFEKSLSAAGEKFIFMQKTRDFISVICDFLQDKAPFIEELEEQMQKLHEERASATLERRNADNNDEMMEVEAAVKAAISVFNKGGNSTSMIATATAAAAAAAVAVREKGSLPVKLDEFGRDENQQKRMDSLRRAEARARRKVRANTRGMHAMDVDSRHLSVEGEWSTDESDSETAAYESNSDQLLQTADQIFSDASEKYSQLSVVKEIFENWKNLYASSYRDAYMALSVPAIFSPYVRLELLKWDPLHKKVDFDNMKWHSLLFDYGLTEQEFSTDDADSNLVPHLVEKVALPILHHHVANCWDVLSTTQTRNAVSATSLIATYDLASSEAFGELLVVVRKRLADVVADLVVPTWNPLVLTAVSNASRVAAYHFGVSVRLMINICLWKEVISIKVLEKLALDELLSGKVLPHLRAIKSNIHDAITRTERIIASLSGVWTGATATALHSNKLQPLVDYVLLLGKTLEKRASGASESETNSLARRVKTMLVELNEYDEARAISRAFHLKEAL
ncbi:hypothetical protein QQ045_011918 [Rhodiola kirilowii]